MAIQVAVPVLLVLPGTPVEKHYSTVLQVAVPIPPAVPITLVSVPITGVGAHNIGVARTVS